MTSKRIVFLGGGGHASDLLGAFEAASAADGGPMPVIGYLDSSDEGEFRFKGRMPRLGTVADLKTIDATHYLIAAGCAATRKRIYEEVRGIGMPAASIIHPFSHVPPGWTMGEGSVLLAGTVVSPLAVVGKHVYVSVRCNVGHDCQVGDFASLMPGAAISGDTVIGEGAMIGTNAVMLEKRRVGAWATVGAGAVVNRDVPEGVTALGIPAKWKS